MQSTGNKNIMADPFALSRRGAMAVLVGWIVVIAIGSTFLHAKTDSSRLELTKAFVDMGIEHCMDRVDDVSRYIVRDGEHASMMYFADTDPEKKMLSLMIGRGSDNDNYLATIDFSQNETCSATYEITKLWSNSCTDVVASAFPEYRRRGGMPGGFELYERSANLHVAVSALADSGCLTVQKELIF